MAKQTCTNTTLESLAHSTLGMPQTCTTAQYPLTLQHTRYATHQAHGDVVLDVGTLAAHQSKMTSGYTHDDAHAVCTARLPPVICCAGCCGTPGNSALIIGPDPTA